MIEADLVAGTWWFFAGPTFASVDFDCEEDPGADYYITVEAACPPCEEPTISGDVDGSGCVDFDDVLAVLSNWDTNGSGGGDNDCTCTVDFDDLLAVLSGFGDGDC